MVNPAGWGAEERAAKWLVSQGYGLVVRNFQTKYGELDLVATKDGVLVVVEVKSRSSAMYGSALAAVTPTKLRRLSLAAMEFIQSISWEGPVEIGAVAIEGDGEPTLTRDIYLP